MKDRFARTGTDRSDQWRAASPLVSTDAVEASPLGPHGLELFVCCLTVADADENFDRLEGDRLAKLANRLGISPKTPKKLRQAAQFGKLEVVTLIDALEAEN